MAAITHISDVLRRFGVHPTEQPVPSQGFSDASIFRVRTHHGEFCLRAWPLYHPFSRIRFAQELIITAQELSFVPRLLRSNDGATILNSVERCWELQTWMPGRADFWQSPRTERLQSACQALARLHQVWERKRVESRVCGALLRRAARRAVWSQLCDSGWQPRFDAGDAVDYWAGRAWNLLSRLFHELAELLTPWEQEAVPVFPCLCDVWHDHVLFTGDEVSGIIDFGNVAIDSPAADLARLLGSLVEDDAERWRQGVAAYAAVRPIMEREILLAKALDKSGTILAAATWLKWLYWDKRPFENRQSVANRLERIVRRLERWT
ncbi:MAG: phosphotransferase [Gemmataceae bacterium]|nr:phosphotransferase [Gemmataceae bacterium]MCI0739390.1 phosphotransferase [Gemmataceae bacterium]